MNRKILLRIKYQVLSTKYKTLCAIFFVFSTLYSVPSSSQSYENSWINYSQDYYKIKIWQDGIYRLSFNALAFPPASVPVLTWTNINNIQLFHKGVEQFIYIYDSDGNGKLDNSSDYIEFYGDKNDGTFDTKMYADPLWQPNSRFSLITDTSVYFITYGLTPGKRLIPATDTSYSAYNTANYFIKEFYQERTSDYNVGAFSAIEYENAEGWVGAPFTDGATVMESASTAKAYSGGPAADINITIAGANNNLHQLRITSPIGINYLDTVFQGYQVKRYYFSVSSSAITSSTTDFNFTSVSIANNSDRMAFVNLSVKYPHTLDMEGLSLFKMYIPDNGTQSKTRLDLTNFSGSSPILYDITNHRRITVKQNGSTYQALVDNDSSATPKFCYITGSSQITNVPGSSITRMNYVSSSGLSAFNNFTATNYAKDSAYIIVAHSSLMGNIKAPGGYKDYRNTTTNNKVIIVDIDELYDQFAYGQKHHGLAIKNFAHFVLDKWTGIAPPQAMFLVGKSIKPHFMRFSPGNWKQCMVASYGYPASDNLLVSGINGSIHEPVIPIGRLSAKNDVDVTNYLAKVQEYEAKQKGPPEDWMKEVLHFGGGANAPEQNAFKSYLRHLESIIEDTDYGGQVTSYFKTSSNPIQINPSDSLKAKINAGVSAMLFFGHASGSSFDVATDEPSTYRNFGKYPIVIASSCYAGDFHDPVESNSEQFVLEPGKAAIAFLASVGLGLSTYLYDYDTVLYNNISRICYGQPFGKIIQETVKRVQSMFPSDPFVKQTVNEMSLQGDPLLKFNSWNKPDLVAEEKNIFFTPSTVTSQSDTFSIHFMTRNFAKAVKDTFHVVITRTFPDGTDSVYTIPRSHCYYSDTMTLTMKAGAFNGAGVNKFTVSVDLDSNRVPEIEDFINNSASTSFFIYSSDIAPVYPPKYAIHPYSTITLKASTVNPLGPTRTYRFEIDTAYFNDSPSSQSPLFRFGNVTSSGGVVSWSPPNYNLLDSTVYYWRVYDDTTVINKNESSFIHIKNTTGWSQAHFFQFKNDGYQNVLKDSANRKYDFGPNIAALKAITYRNPYFGNNDDLTGYYINNSVQEYSGGCGVGGAQLMFAVIDSLTLQPWNNCNVYHGHLNQFLSADCFSNPTVHTCRSRFENYFIYSFNNPSSFDSLQQWVNTIPDGHYLLFYSWATTTYSANSGYGTLNTMFTNLGITEWQNTSALDNQPFIFFIKKGDVSSKIVKIGTSSDSEILLNVTMHNQWYRGNIISEAIGPAAKWSSLHWRQHPLESNSKDSINLSILGLNSTKNSFDTILFAKIVPANYDTSLSGIDAKKYPYLKFNAYLEDLPLRTPPQLDKWQVYYDEVPECALNPNRHFSFYKNPIDEGDTIRMSIAIDNIGNLPMDSLPVSFYFYDKSHKRYDIKTTKLDSLRVGQSLTASIVIDTTFGYSGSNSLWVEANPNGSLHLPEQYHPNNIAEVKFNISRDVINPILDVVFDGVHILDGDIVSGKPHITIGLHDENKFLALNDTGKFNVYIKTPSGQSMQQLHFSQPSFGSNMRFTPAVLPKNSCKIEFDPVLDEDGTYVLEVEATDRSNNESGKYHYRISFEVINKSTITQVLNYPNPFTTSTRFVFILTGNQVPDHMRIRIMTVSGKIVREIGREELGNIHVGRNITYYAWDGKDQYGDQLANGVYLYKVDTELKDGETIEHRETAADKYFKKNWGKMFLMR